MKRNDEAGQDFRLDRHLSRGGVGYYPHPGFVDVEVGPVRHC